MALLHSDDVERRIGARSFARLLGDWRPPTGRGISTALADRVRLLVLDGRLPLQMRVPAERELASALEVSRTTVSAAYTSPETGYLPMTSVADNLPRSASCSSSSSGTMPTTTGFA